MTTADTLRALADRVEAAAGPDREIDAEIVRALCPDARISFLCVGDDEPVVFHEEPLVQNKRELPAYTASLDASKTLVPEDCLENVRALWDGRRKAYQGLCHVYRPSGDSWIWCRDTSAVCSHAANALTAAALRARAAKEEL